MVYTPRYGPTWPLSVTISSFGLCMLTLFPSSVEPLTHPDSVRQVVTLHVLRPLAHSLGIRGGKVMRFLERE